MLLFLLVFSFLVYLFCLFVLTKDDFIVLRKDISVERIFNLGFLTTLAGLFSARFFYILLNFDLNLLNPFAFFLFTHFPGLSLIGGVIGGGIFSLIYSKNKKMPIGHIIDFIVISFLCSLSVGSFINLLLIRKINFSLEFLFPFLFLMLFIAILIIYQKIRLKEGSTGALGVTSLSFVLFLINHFNQKTFILNREDLFLIVVFLSLLGFFIKQEGLLRKIKGLQKLNF